MDITGIQMLDGVVGKLRRRGVLVVLCEANERVATKLRQAAVIDDAPGGDHAATLSDAVRRLVGQVGTRGHA